METHPHKRYSDSILSRIKKLTMNIAILSRVLYLSGLTTHIIELSRELVQRGHNVYIFTSGPELSHSKANLKLIENLQNTGVAIIRIPFPANPRHKISYVFKMMASIPFVHRALIENKIEVIHVHTPVLSFLPAIFGRKYVKTTHIKNIYLPILNRKATHEITISTEIHEESKDKFGYHDDQVSLIFNGVNTGFAIYADKHQKKLIKDKFGIPHGKVIIGIVGSIHFRKGHDVLINAISKLTAELKKCIHLIIVGDGDNDEELLLHQLLENNKLLPLSSKFKFQDPKPIYDVVDIFVLPSRLEGFPLVTLEAFMSGCCVVRSNVEGAYDQIKDRETGFIFQSEDSDALSNILQKLIIDKDLRESVAARGRDFALANFTSEIMASKTLEVYQKVAQTGMSVPPY